MKYNTDGVRGVFVVMKILKYYKCTCFLLLLLYIISLSNIVHAEEYEYDSDGRVVSVSHDDGSYTKYEYDKNGNLIRTITVESSDYVEGNNKADDNDEKFGDSDQKEKIDTKKSVNTPENHKSSNDYSKGAIEKKEIEVTNANTGDDSFIIPAITVFVIMIVGIVILSVIRKRR